MTKMGFDPRWLAARERCLARGVSHAHRMKVRLPRPTENRG